VPAASPYKILEMSIDESSQSSAAEVNPFSAEDVASILRERGWLAGELSPAQTVWCDRAVALLGPRAADLAALGELLALVFHYDAREILARVDSHVVLSRYGAREVLRELALLLLEGASVTSDRFKEIVSHLKDKLEIRGRELFHPIRLALAGRAGEGELDRVILLLDEAAELSFAPPVKSTRARILEFCAALD